MSVFQNCRENVRMTGANRDDITTPPKLTNPTLVLAATAKSVTPKPKPAKQDLSRFGRDEA